MNENQKSLMELLKQFAPEFAQNQMEEKAIDRSKAKNVFNSFSKKLETK